VEGSGDYLSPTLEKDDRPSSPLEKGDLEKPQIPPNPPFSRGEPKTPFLRAAPGGRIHSCSGPMRECSLIQSEKVASSISFLAKANTATTTSASDAVNSHPLNSRKT